MDKFHAGTESYRYEITGESESPRGATNNHLFSVLALLAPRLSSKTSARQTMASLPPALDFPKTEEEICDKWAKEQTFKKQDELALERGDEVRSEKWGRQVSFD
jgi:hypothetical protein